jgi:hypothetical protein
MSATLAAPNFNVTASDGTLTRQADGTYLAIWIAGTAIRGQMFNADGMVKDGPFDVASGSTTYADVSAALLSNGDMVVTWGQDGATKAQRLGTNGQPVGAVEDIGSGEVLNQHAPEVYALANSKFMTEVFNASTPENAAPQIANLNGDSIIAAPGATVFLDAGANALVTDDGLLGFLGFGSWGLSTARKAIAWAWTHPAGSSSRTA